MVMWYWMFSRLFVVQNGADAMAYKLPAHKLSAVEQQIIHCISCKGRMVALWSEVVTCYTYASAPLTWLFEVSLTAPTYMYPHSQWFNHKELLLHCVICLHASFLWLLCLFIAGTRFIHNHWILSQMVSWGLWPSMGMWGKTGLGWTPYYRWDSLGFNHFPRGLCLPSSVVTGISDRSSKEIYKCMPYEHSP